MKEKLINLFKQCCGINNKSFSKAVKYNDYISKYDIDDVNLKEISDVIGNTKIDLTPVFFDPSIPDVMITFEEEPPLLLIPGELHINLKYDCEYVDVKLDTKKSINLLGKLSKEYRKANQVDGILVRINDDINSKLIELSDIHKTDRLHRDGDLFYVYNNSVFAPKNLEYKSSRSHVRPLGKIKSWNEKETLRYRCGILKMGTLNVILNMTEYNELVKHHKESLKMHDTVLLDKRLK